MKRRVGVLINPTARNGKGKVNGKKLIKYLKYNGLEVFNISGSDWYDAIKKAKTGLFTKNLDAFIVAGGDGTVHLGTNIIAETQLPFGIVPIGTGNDIARALSLPENDVKKSANIIINGLKNNPTPVDLGHISDLKKNIRYQWFLGNVAGGFASKVSTRKEKIKFPKGPTRYMISMFIELLMLKSEKYRVIIDGKSKDFESILFGVGNGPDIGGGMRLFPHASFDNHQLEFSSVIPLGKKKFIELASKVKKENLINTPELQIDRGQEIIVEAKSATANIIADGENIGLLPMKYTIVPNGLYVIGAKPIHRTKFSEKLSKDALNKFTDNDTKNILRRLINKKKK